MVSPEDGDVQRDREWVEREYGRDKWPEVAELIAELSDGTLAGTLARVLRAEAGIDERTPTEQVVETVKFLGWVAHTVASAASDADAVIELGSGWGRQLLGVRCAGGPSEALYVAAEFTDAGRAASERLAAHDPSLDFRAAAFDYHAPTLDVPQLDRAVVFSVHSVEQIPRLGDGFVPFIRGLAREVTVLHFEPVGWQLTGGDDSYAVEHDYNRNLVPLLRHAESRGEILITRVETDVVATNPSNPTSLIVWRPRTPGVAEAPDGHS